MDNTVKSLLGLILAVVLLVLTLQVVGMIIGRPIINLTLPEWNVWQYTDFRAWGNVLLAVFVGALGAWAFHLGVLTGFISRTDRTRVLEFLLDDQQQSRHFRVWGFIVTGGIVAGVFQAAQTDTFAPIQAFVLGATWPSVVTRIMSGGGDRPAPTSNPADTPAPQVPTPPSGNVVRPAEVNL